MPYKTASSILNKRLEGRPDLLVATFIERFSVESARAIYTARKEAGLTQRQLADRVGTSQAAIARLENSDYGVKTFQMVERVGEALGLTIRMQIVATDENGNEISKREHVFGVHSKEANPSKHDQEQQEDTCANNNYAYAA